LCRYRRALVVDSGRLYSTGFVFSEATASPSGPLPIKVTGTSFLTVIEIILARKGATYQKDHSEEKLNILHRSCQKFLSEEFSHKEIRIMMKFTIAVSNIISCVLTALIALHVSRNQRQTRKLQQTCCNCPSIVECPSQVGSKDIIADDGLLVKLQVSQTLCTLVQFNGHFIKPMARSYDGYGWEASAGEFASLLNFTCDSSLCFVSLPPPSDGYYQLTTFQTPNYSEDDVLVRFLEQTTFGPTRADLSEASKSSSLAQWIQNQQLSVELSSHRAFYRHHLNARRESATAQSPATHPCLKGSRYRRYAFTNHDLEKYMEVQSLGNDRYSLSVDGFVRTVVSGPITARWDGSIVFEEGRVQIGWLSKFSNCVGCWFELMHQGDGYEVSFGGTINGTPPIEFDSGVTPFREITTLSPTNVQVFKNAEELILTEDLSDPTCETLGATGNPSIPIFGLFQGEYWIHDACIDLLENTLESPDSGGQEVRDTVNLINPDKAAKCSNAPRTFLNDASCRVASDPLACTPSSGIEEEERPNNLYIDLTPEFLRDIYEFTANSSGGDTIYLYVIRGLRVDQDPMHPKPCERYNYYSRWECIVCPIVELDDDLNSIFGSLLSWYEGDLDDDAKVGDILDIWNWEDEECPPDKYDMVGFTVKDLEGNCWKHIHQDEHSVYDFTYWTQAHPGNSEARNPITEFAIDGLTTLTFPSWHEMGRWNGNKYDLDFLGTVGGQVHYYDLPERFRTPEISSYFGFTLEDVVDDVDDNSLIMICGSPYEIDNDPFAAGRMDAINPIYDFAEYNDLLLQKRVVWTEIVLMSKNDQLRQRMAWALSQILVVTPDAITNEEYVTEALVTYYDIFVRHAFGNYLDILKEVSYSPVMAEMLTYFQSMSTAYVWYESSNLEYADENYAREIMQLFSIGLYLLNSDGSQVLDEADQPIRAYTNDDIVEYARVWTGFDSQPVRGNIESDGYFNQVDPMKIRLETRDVFPKMGLNRTYIGDGYPLCSDLPERHFLQQGAIYRFLGSSSTPTLLNDPQSWDEANAQRLKLQPSNDGTSSSLFSILCGSSDPTSCTYDKSTVVLDSNLVCVGKECEVDIVRVVEVGERIFYEYTQPPCVHFAFPKTPKLVVRRGEWWHLSCADPRTTVASAACCPDEYEYGEWMDLYWGERTTLATAQKRCGSRDLCQRGYAPCEYDNTTNAPEESYCDNSGQFWTNTDCSLRVKISDDAKVAILHLPNGIEPEAISHLVSEADTKTFFRVDWSDTVAVENLITNCEAPCATTSDGFCMCGVSVTEDQAYQEMSTLPSSEEEILRSLRVGSFRPSGSMISNQISNNYFVHTQTAGVLESDSVFEVRDHTGVHYLKNLKSEVQIVGTSISFRNAVHFISIADPELRDAQYETDAALDQYFHHSNTAPFLAKRLTQRFGISNPTPGFISRIANAFKIGTYTSDDGILFGSQEYGDLGATIASLLLDREARNVILDADPSHGSMKEPLIKWIGFLRSSEFSMNDNNLVNFVRFAVTMNQKIGQMVYAIPNVFSFFLPEFSPSGPIERASIVAPEGQVINGPKIIDAMNGILSLINYGLAECYGGLGVMEYTYCEDYQIGSDSNEGSIGTINYLPTDSSNIVDELATLLTAGRLSLERREIIKNAVNGELNPSLAIRKVQQIMVFAPEFHVTNLVHLSSSSLRPNIEKPPPSSRPYKALVYLMLDGGVDSFNMIAPHTCAATNNNGETLLEQYYSERTTIAITQDERSRVVAASGQPCNQFVIHQDLAIVEQLYNSGELSFFANTGVINRPVNKQNYWDVTKTQLFAHNAMIEEAQKIDPFSGMPGTGVLGRLCDVLNNKGYNCQPITIEDANAATIGVPGSAVEPLFVSAYGSSEFNPGYNDTSFDPRPYIDQINEANELQSSLFGETWSQRLAKSLSDNQVLVESLSSTQLGEQFPDTDFSNKIKAVATLIASRKNRGTDRDVFYVSLGGWDNHANLKTALALQFQDLNSALTSFYKEMINQNMWNDVTIVTVSDFARTLTANSGDGSDHAWGGNYPIMGGRIKGGLIHGEYPSDITTSGPYNIGRGRLIPTLSWESILHSVLQDMGVETEIEMDYCLPNRIQTGTRMFAKSELFQDT